MASTKDLEIAGENRFYYNSDNVMKVMGGLSLTNEFKVSIRWLSTENPTGSLAAFVDEYVSQRGAGEKFDFGFYASDAVLPGSNLVSAEIYGNYQGMNQAFAVSRQYPEVEVTLYVDSGHRSLLALQAWQEFVNPGFGGDSVNARKKLNYPDQYKCDVVITKFNRDFYNSADRLKGVGESSAVQPELVSYTLKRAFPTKIIATPISYGEAQIVKTVVSFNYEQYLVSKKDRGQSSDLRLPPRTPAVTR